MSMRAASPIRRAAVFFCVVLVLLAALIPSGSSLPLAVLVTLCFFVPVATFVFLPHVDEQNQPQQAFKLPAFSPRPPPAQLSLSYFNAYNSVTLAGRVVLTRRVDP